MTTNTDRSNNSPRGVAPERIAQLLTRAAQQLDENTVATLCRARGTALERQSQNKPVFELSTGRGIHWLAPHSSSHRITVIIILMAIFFGGLSYWQHAHENDIARLDAAILTDDLPLEVFVD